MGEASNANNNKTDLIRVFSFQRGSIVEDILTKGKYQFNIDIDEHWKAYENIQRHDKIEFYQSELKLPENIIPLFTFFRLGGFHPVSLSTLRMLWANLMGYF